MYAWLGNKIEIGILRMHTKFRNWYRVVIPLRKPIRTHCWEQWHPPPAWLRHAGKPYQMPLSPRCCWRIRDQRLENYLLLAPQRQEIGPQLASDSSHERIDLTHHEWEIGQQLASDTIAMSHLKLLVLGTSEIRNRQQRCAYTATPREVLLPHGKSMVHLRGIYKRQ